MVRFLFWRLVQSVAVLWTVYTVTFVLLMLVPGDPFVGEKKPPDVVLRGLAKTYGLDYLALPEKERAALTRRSTRVTSRSRIFSSWRTGCDGESAGRSIEYAELSRCGI